MPTTKGHNCTLRLSISNGLPRLAPNASSFERLCRRLREHMILNPNILKCRKFFRNRSSIFAEQKRHSGGPYFYIIHPYSNFSALIQILFFVTWVYRMIEMPMRFNSAIEKKNTANFDRYVIVPLQWTIVMVLFFMGYEDTKQRKIEIRPKKIWRRYLTTYFLFDLLAVGYIFLILDEIVIPLLTHRQFHYMWFTPTRVIRIFCFYTRVNTVLDFLNAIGYLLKLKREIRQMFRHVLRTALILHLFTCLLYFVPVVVYYDRWPETSWTVQAGIDPESYPDDIKLYAECSLLAMCHFFGASRGIYKIVEPVDMICLSFISYFGRLYTLFVLADTLWLFGITNVAESNYERFSSQLEAYIESKDLPPYLKKRLTSYYEFKLQKHYFNEPQILSTLSESLRLELFVFGIRRLMEKSEIFRSIPRTFLPVVMANLKSVGYSPGDVIVQIGVPVDNVYFISSGSVAVINEEGMELCHLTDGESFGMTTLLASGLQKYEFAAIEPSEVYFADRNFIKEIMIQSEELSNLFKSFLKRKIEFYNKLDEVTRRGGTTVLAQLNRKRLLEQPVKRPAFTDQ